MREEATGTHTGVLPGEAPQAAGFRRAMGARAVPQQDQTGNTAPFTVYRPCRPPLTAGSCEEPNPGSRGPDSDLCQGVCWGVAQSCCGARGACLGGRGRATPVSTLWSLPFGGADACLLRKQMWPQPVVSRSSSPTE